MNDINETALIASSICNLPLSVEQVGDQFELVSGKSKLAKTNTKKEMFRLLQGMMLGRQFRRN